VRVFVLCEGGPRAPQERLGELAGLHRNYIGPVERGEYNPTLVSQVKIAKALGVSIAEMVKGLRVS